MFKGVLYTIWTFRRGPITLTGWKAETSLSIRTFAPLEISTTTKQAGIIVLDAYCQERKKYVLDLVSKVKFLGYDLNAYLYLSTKFLLYGH